MTNHEHAKSLYCQRTPISDIAQILGVSRTTIYAYKNKDLARGIDWDNLRFIKATDSKAAERNEQDFLAVLIGRFETSLDVINQLEPDKQLKELTQYANTYYKLKMQRDNPKVNKADVAKQVLHTLSSIALEHQSECVIEFLSTHADEIVNAVID